jgi:hypothetical protein
MVEMSFKNSISEQVGLQQEGQKVVGLQQSTVHSALFYCTSQKRKATSYSYTVCTVHMQYFVWLLPHKDTRLSGLGIRPANRI